MTTLRNYRARLTGAGLELRIDAVVGAAANTDIPLTGIKPGDVLVAVLEVQPPTAASGNTIVADRKANTTVKQGAINLNVATSGNQLLVVWWAV